APVAAPAHGAVVVVPDVADLAGGALCPVVHAAVEDESGADPGGDAEVDQVGHATGGGEGHLAARAEVRLVLDAHPHSQPLGQFRAGRAVGPAARDAVGGDGGQPGVDRRGYAERHGPDRLRRDGEPVEQGTDQVGGVVEADVHGGAGVQVDGLFGEDVVGEVG